MRDLSIGSGTGESWGVMSRFRGLLVVLPALAVALAALWFFAGSAGPAQAQVGGPIFFSGDDADDGGHCQGTACGGVYPAMLSLVVNNSASGGSGIAAIGVNGSSALTALNSWNSVANGGPGATITHFTTATDIQNVNFANFAAIYIPSNFNTPGGITDSQIAELNARQADIVNFVNTLGGGIMALTEAGSPNQYGWLPLPLTTVNLTHQGLTDIQPTAALTALAPSATGNVLNHGCCYHTVFTGPSGFSGLQVLANHPADGHVVMLGGLQVTIQGTIELSPATDKNLVGTTHTVTAFAQNGSPLSPVAGVTVSFQVSNVLGPNFGEVSNPGECSVNADCTTDAAGNVSWTYTGSGGVGTDLIVASFVDGAGNLQTSNTVNKIWQAPPNLPPVFGVPPSPCGQNLKVTAGQKLQFVIAAGDPDVGDVVTLGVINLPSGATFPIPAAANPVSSTFNWTPTAGQAGGHVVTFTAADNSGAAAAPCVANIQVNLPPDEQININVVDKLSGAKLEGTCWRISYGPAKIQHDVVGDDTAGVKPDCGEPSNVKLFDKDPSAGNLRITITSAQRVQFGDIWHAQMSFEPKGRLDTFNYVCDLSVAKCEIGPVAVGGLAVDLDGDLGDLPLGTAQSSGSNAGLLAGVIAAVTVGAVTLSSAAWYARRRWVR